MQRRSSQESRRFGRVQVFAILFSVLMVGSIMVPVGAIGPSSVEDGGLTDNSEELKSADIDGVNEEISDGEDGPTLDLEPAEPEPDDEESDSDSADDGSDDTTANEDENDAGPNDRVSPTTFDAEEGEILWEADESLESDAAPTVVDGILVIVASDRVVAYDVGTGEERWATEISARGSPTVVDGTVYVSGSDGVWALDLELGAIEWHVESDEDAISSTGYQSVGDGGVYVSWSDQSSGTVLSLDAETGDENWSIETNSQVYAGPTFNNGTVYYVTSDGMIAVDAGKGDEQWTWDEIGTLQDRGAVTEPTIVDGLVYFSYTEGLGSNDPDPDDYELFTVAIDEETGETEWEVEFDDPQPALLTTPSSPTVSGEGGESTVYVGQDGLYALKAADGTERWSDNDAVADAPTVADGTLFVPQTTDSEAFRALDPKDGTELWSVETGDRSNVIVVDGVAYAAVTSGDERIIAINAGVSGSSSDSRVMLGGQNNHHQWTGDIPDSDPRVVDVEFDGGAFVEDELTVTATVRNDWDPTTSATVTLQLEDDLQVSRTVEVPAYGTKTVELPLTAPSESGEYALGINDEESGTLTVVDENDPIFRSVLPFFDTRLEGNQIQVSYEAMNLGEYTDENTTLSLDGPAFDDREDVAFVDAEGPVNGEKETYIFVTDPIDEPGTYTAYIEDEEIGTIEVLPDGEPIYVTETNRLQASIISGVEAPLDPSAAGEASVDVRYENLHQNRESVESELVAYDDGGIEVANDTRNLDVDGESTVTERLSVSLAEAGTYHLEVDGQSVSTVEVLVDGVQDGDSIQDAIDAAQPGDTVFVGNGTYEESLTIDKELTLRSVVERGAVLDGTDGLEGAIRVESDDVTVDGFRIEGYSGGDGAVFVNGDEFTLRNSTLVDNDVSGLYLTQHNDGFTIEGNVISGNVDGITYDDGWYGSDNVVIENNSIADNSGTGIKLGTDWSNVAIVNNTVTSNADGIVVGDGEIRQNNVTATDGIAIQVRSGTVVADNTIEGAEWGILRAGTSSMDGTVIEGNTFRDISQAIPHAGDDTIVRDNEFSGTEVDLVLDDAINVTVTDNQFATGVRFDGVPENLDEQPHEMSGNTVGEDDLFYAAGVSDPTIPENPGQIILVDVENATVSGLDIDGVISGIQVVHSAGVTIADNELATTQTSHGGISGSISVWSSTDATIEQNVITESDRAIYVVDSDGASITDNRIEDGSYAGISIRQEHVSSFEETTTVSGNEIETDQRGVDVISVDSVEILENKISQSDRGIYIDGGENLRIDGNSIENADSGGIRIGIPRSAAPVSSVDDVEVTNNVITGSGGHGIEVDGRDGTTIESNTVIDNADRGIFVDFGSDAGSIHSNDVRNNDVGLYLFARNDDVVAIHDNAIAGNDQGLVYDGHGTLNATNNWWGHESGPSGEGDGDGDSVGENIDYEPFLNENPIGAPPLEAYFDVVIDDMNSPVDTGEDLEVTVTVTNVGEKTGTQTISLEDFDGTVVDTKERTLDGGEDETLALTWTTDTDNVGSGEVTVKSQDDIATAPVSVTHDGPVTITESTTITTPGTYLLDEDLTKDSTAIVIDANDVVFDGQGHTIQGADVDGSQYGIHVDGADNVTLTDVTIDGWDTGLYFSGSDGVVTDVLVENGGTGAEFANAHNNEVTNLVTRHNDYRGLEVGSGWQGYSHDNVFTNVTAYQNEAQQSALSPGAVQVRSGSTGNVFVGLDSSSSQAGLTTFGSGNTFVDVTADDNSMYGLNLESNVGNEFENVSVSGNGWNGIVVDDSSGNVLRDVTASGNYGEGIYLIGDSRSNEPVVHNEFHGVTATENEGSGIGLTAADDSTFTDVTLIDNTGSSLSLVRQSSGNTFTNVTVIGGTWDAVHVASSENYNNAFEDVTIDGSPTGMVIYGENTTVSNLTVTDVEGADVLLDGESDTTLDRLTLGDATVTVVGNGVQLNAAAGSGTGPDGFDSLSRYVEVTSLDDDAALAELRIYYDAADLGDLDESTLGIWRYDGTWHAPGDEPYESGVDANEGYVYATGVTGFSTFGVFGELDDVPDPDPEPASFDVTIDGTADPVVAGEDLLVTATVENTGDEDGTQTVELVADGTVLDEIDVTLTGGESETVTLVWATSTGDAGDAITIVVESDDSEASTDVTVEAAYADLTVVDGTLDRSDVEVGESVTISAEVTNDGTIAGDETISLEIDGVVADDATVSVAPGTTETVTFEHVFADAGEYAVTIGGTAVDTVTVAPPPASFDVLIESTDAPVVAGEPLSTVATVENLGGIESSQTIELVVDGTVVDTVAVSLDGGERETVTLVWATEAEDAGDVSVVVRSDDDEAAAAATVEAAYADLVVVDGTIDPDSVLVDETVTVLAEVTNDGTVSGTRTLTLATSDVSVANETVTVDAGTTETIAFEHAFGAAGEYDLTVDGAPIGTVAVAEPASFDVTIENTTTPVVAGEELDVTTTLTNTGDISATQPIELVVDGTVVDAIDVSLDGGEHETVTLVWATEAEDAGDVSVVVRSDDDEAATATTVEAAYADLVIVDGTVDPTAVTVGDSVAVVVEVTNDGTVAGNEELDFEVDGVPVDAETISVEPGATGTVTFEHAFDEAGEHDLTVNGTAVGTVAVADPDASVLVYGASADRETVGIDESVTVSVDFFNSGDQPGIETLVLDVDGEAVDEATVFVESGITRDGGTLSWTPAPGDIPDEGESAEVTLSVNGFVVETVTIENQFSDVQVIAASLSETDVIQGEEVYAIGSIYQDGTAEGPETIDLVAIDQETGDEIHLGSQEVTLSPGFYHLGALNITAALEEPGIYDLELGDRSAGTVEVEPAVSDIQVIAASTSEIELIEGEEAYTVGSIYQAGNVEETETIDLVAIDQDTGEEIVLGSQDVTLSPGFYHLGAINITFAPEPGTYDLELGDRSAGTVEVEPGESDIQVIAASTSEIELIEGEEAYTVGSIYQSGNVEGTETIELTATNTETNETEIIGSQEVTLSPGFYHLGALNISFAPEESGTYDLELGDRSAGTVEVEAAESDIQVIAASTSELELIEGEEAYTVGSIYQAGNVEGTETIDLVAIDQDTGEETDMGSQEVTLSPGFYHLGALNITFAPDEPGTYDLELGGQNAGAIDVEPAVSDIQVIAASPDGYNLTVGEEVNVIGSVYQAGNIEGTQEISLNATHRGTNETVSVGSQEVTLSSGFYHLGALNISFTPEEAGTYDLELGGRDAGSVSVEQSLSDIQVVGSSVADVELIEGEHTSVTGSIYQAGEEGGTETIELTATNTETNETDVVGSQDVTLDPGFYHLGAINITFEPHAPGTYDLHLGERYAGWVEVEAAESDIQVIAASTSEIELIEGEEAYTVGSIYQSGNVEGTETIELTATNTETNETEIIGSQEVTLSPGFYHLGALNISFAPEESGTYDLELGDRSAGTVEVEAAESDIQVIAASTSEIEVLEGEELYVVGSIYQAGNVEGTETIDLVAIDQDTGEEMVLGSQEVTLAPGFYHLGALNVTATIDDPGVYDLKLGDRDAGELDVTEAYSDVQVIAASSSEIEIALGQELHVVGSIYQAGNVEGTETIELVAIDQDSGEEFVVDSQEVTLAPGFYHLGALNITFQPEQTGAYELRLGDRYAGTVEVVEPTVDPSITNVEGYSDGYDLDLEADAVYASEDTTVTIDVESDFDLEEATLLVSSMQTTYSVGVDATHDGSDRWTAEIPLDALPDDGAYEVSVIAVDEQGNAGMDAADELLVIDRNTPSMSVTIEDVDGDSATVVVESDEPLSDVPDVSAVVVHDDGSTSPVTVTLDGTSNSDQLFTGTIEFEESGEYVVTATGTDRAGNVGSNDVSTVINTGFTIGDGEIVIDETGTTITFDVIEEAEQAILAEELFLALSENSVNTNLGAGELGVGFLTAQLDGFIDYHMESGTIESATVSMAIDEHELDDGASVDDVGLYHLDETSGDWNAVDSTVTYYDDDPFVVADVTRFSTYGALVIDEEPPEIVDVSPADGTSLDAETEEITVGFEYEDALSGVDVGAVALTVNGEDVTDGENAQITGSVAEYTFDVAPGESYVAEITVADNAGNVASAETAFEVEDEVDPTPDEPPEIVDVSPADGTSLDAETEEITVGFEYEGVSSTADGAVALTVNGEDVTDDENAQITDSVAQYVLAVAPGESYAATLTILAEDGSDVTAETSFAVEDAVPDDDEDDSDGTDDASDDERADGDGVDRSADDSRTATGDDSADDDSVPGFGVLTVLVTIGTLLLGRSLVRTRRKKNARS
ncbi:right-handed parallel beta-helix repeat-containing protein [Halobacteria archaeon AArc-dxtr1]|nr:right-handed parallel beta-helix repeat-containing protein [Halobacteria archaeon AArc-dxtr1]